MSERKMGDNSQTGNEADETLGQRFFLKHEQFDHLLELLKREDYSVIGPTIEQGAIVYAEIESAEDLPKGWTDHQGPGTYRIEKREDEARFGYNLGPRSWKHFLFPPRVTLSHSTKGDDGLWKFTEHEDAHQKMAFIGVRSCELEAIKIQDRIFLEGPYVDPVYAAHRSNILIVAVNCTSAVSTCFCTSMDTGPECRSGYDLSLTEIQSGFVAQAGSSRGENLLGEVSGVSATSGQLQDACQARQNAIDQIDKKMETDGLAEELRRQWDHPHWDDVAERCLSCTNCTLVCPTCFCSTVKEVGDLSGENIERQRQWDSCFNVDFSYMNGGVVRDNIRNRYRQWLTHKLATWEDQFDTSGCVGCGRCISWCPVGIDLTREVAAIRETP